MNIINLLKQPKSAARVEDPPYFLYWDASTKNWVVMELGNVSDKQHYRGKSEHLAAKKMLELACLASDR